MSTDRPSTLENFNRRDFIGAALIAAGVPPGFAGAHPVAAEKNAAHPEKLILSAPLTHSDWMMKKGIAWGSEGIKHMLDACKACGWSRIYWRALDGGRALYKSTLLTPGEHIEYDWIYNPLSAEDKELLKKYFPSMSLERRREISDRVASLDYSTFDSLADAVSYGHRIGLKIHAWVSINEDDHGWGIRSDFSLRHPECRWRRRDGGLYRSQISFAFPQAMDYKAGIIKELVENYDLDGIFLDWIRTGDVRDNPQTDPQGVADHGYEEPVVKGFRARYGADPREIPNGDDRWVRFRAESHTRFMRRVREIAQAKKPGFPVSVMVAHPWCYRGFQDKIDGNLRGLLLDVTTWAREGLMDDAVAAGYYRDGGTPEMAYDALRRETEGKVNVWLYGWVPKTAADFERDFALAARLGAKQILFWEADYIDDRANKEELQRSMCSHASMQER